MKSVIYYKLFWCGFPRCFIGPYIKFTLGYLWDYWRWCRVELPGQEVELPEQELELEQELGLR
jgi:hypothetical protein